MPRTGEEDDDGAVDPTDVAVERLEEPRPVGRIRRNERVDEHDRVLGFPVDAPDVLLPVVGRFPLRMRGGPPPEPFLDPRHLHGVEAR